MHARARAPSYVQRTHVHQVIVIENPFRRNFDTVADSPSCLLSDMPACEMPRGFATRRTALAERNSDALLRRETSVLLARSWKNRVD